MIVGIDAYFLFERYNTGIGTLTSNIIKALSVLDKENTYILFTPKINHHNVANEILKNKNFKIIEYKGCFSKYRRLWLQNPGLIYKIINEKVDIFWGGGEYIPLLLPKKIRCVVSIHDVVYVLFPDTIKFTDRVLYHTLFPLCVRKSDAIITVSNTSKEEIIAYLKPEKPIFVAYNGIYLDRYTSNIKNMKENFILFVGTIQPRKNLINMIKAFELIAKEVDCSLVIVGASGWKNSDIKKLIDVMDPKITEKIQFMGYVDNDALIELYTKAQVFVAPSLHEGFGLIILEALASGTPVVTSIRGAIPEVFGDSVLYADPMNPEDIKDKVIDIIKNAKKKNEMSEYGLQYAKPVSYTHL
ncbi:MAG: glycosyltransferase family 4 protein, partial [Candidatus Goldbacteria bacterium]|nr:glycosyltransferase family 4 protein [Candidatus Goldiibacteriota bacterium]